MALTATDAYKLSHKGFMEPNTEVIYSNFTPRSDKYLPVLKDRFDHKITFFGLQYFIKDFLIREWNDKFFSQPKEKVIAKYKRIFDNYLGKDAVTVEHFEELHDLGYLPIRIKALPEGSAVNIKVPFLTVENTDKRFAWLTNYLETVLSCELWKPSTVATIIREYRKLANEFAIKTTGSTQGTDFQIHGFEFRGMSGRHDAAINGAAFLLSSRGTDTVPAIELLEEFYGADSDKEFIATSVPASEHALASTGIAVRGELETYRKWVTEDYPTGVVSIIADTLDFFRVVTEFATEIKEDILDRVPNEIGLAKVVFRPDSGVPEDIICGDKNAPVGSPEYKGAVECLWDIFGGTVTEQGYKVLNERVGLIYGDSITLERALEIYTRLEAKGFASTNVVFGVGSYTSQYLTRDSAGMAMKAVYAEVDGKGYALSKDPKTDDGTKKSAKGLLRVEKVGDDFVLFDQQTREQEQQGELKVVFEDGKLVKETTLNEIRNLMWG